MLKIKMHLKKIMEWNCHQFLHGSVQMERHISKLWSWVSRGNETLFDRWVFGERDHLPKRQCNNRLVARDQTTICLLGALAVHLNTKRAKSERDETGERSISLSKR